MRTRNSDKKIPQRTARNRISAAYSKASPMPRSKRVHDRYIAEDEAGKIIRKPTRKVTRNKITTAGKVGGQRGGMKKRRGRVAK